MESCLCQLDECESFWICCSLLQLLRNIHMVLWLLDDPIFRVYLLKTAPYWNVFFLSLQEERISSEQDNNLHEQLISRDWLRHSTVDRRTLRPPSMVHFDPCQQPCCPARTPSSSSVRQTCKTHTDTEEIRKHIRSELRPQTRRRAHEKKTRRRDRNKQREKTRRQVGFAGGSEWIIPTRRSH